MQILRKLFNPAIAGRHQAEIAAAERGDVKAQFLLASKYFNGQSGIPPDLKTAAYWFGRAAAQGYPPAQFNLALMHENGFGMPVDLNKAIEFYVKAADNNLPEAQFNLAKLLLDIDARSLTNEYQAAALQLLKRAASLGHKKAQQVIDIQSIGSGI